MWKLILITLIISANLYADNNKLKHDYPWGISIEGLVNSETTTLIKNKYKNSTPKYINFFVQWNKFNSLNIIESLKNISSIKAIPILTWEPIIANNSDRKTIEYIEILEGKYDFYIDQIATEIKRFDQKIIVRLMHEMNLPQYHWGYNSEVDKDNYSKIYIKLYRYIVDRFKSQNVSNVAWAFCPNNESVPNEEWNNLENFYPGDNYVDIIGLDAYNWGDFTRDDWHSTWKSLDQLTSDSLRKLKSLASNKDIMIFETATVGNESEKIKWINEALLFASENNLRSIIFFDINKEMNWEIPSSF